MSSGEGVKYSHNAAGFPPLFFFFFGRVAGFALYLAWMRRVYHLSLPLSKLCVRELQLSPQFNVITEMCAS